MKLRYVGPKAIISHKGIEFDNNKEDEFAYLNISLQILRAIYYQPKDSDTYVYDIFTPRFTKEELYAEIDNFCQNIRLLASSDNSVIIDEVEHEIKEARKDIDTLSNFEKISLENNISLMRDYLTQRAINKRVYNCVIDELANVIEKYGIKLMITPMFQKFSYVLNSLKESLAKKSIDSTLEVYQEEDKLFIKFTIN